MATYRLISSDSHVYEPQDLWTSRMPAQFQDRAPLASSLRRMATGGIVTAAR